ncbi:MAG: ZIP family metal transporter [bacterium]
MEAILYSLIAAAASIAGIMLATRWQRPAMEHSHVVNSIAAGVILGVAFLSLIPETRELNPGALPFILAGFLALYLVETVVIFHGGAEMHYEGVHDHVHTSRGWAVFSGLFLHSLIDGIVIGVGFAVSEPLGVIAAASVTIHKLPEGAITFSLLISRISRRGATILSLMVAMAAPVGTLAGLVALPGIDRSVLGYLLALATGSFIYIGASDLVPETHTEKARVNAVFLLAGVALAFLLIHVLHMG